MTLPQAPQVMLPQAPQGMMLPQAPASMTGQGDGMQKSPRLAPAQAGPREGQESPQGLSHAGAIGPALGLAWEPCSPTQIPLRFAPHVLPSVENIYCHDDE